MNVIVNTLVDLALFHTSANSKAQHWWRRPKAPKAIHFVLRQIVAPAQTFPFWYFVIYFTTRRSRAPNWFFTRRLNNGLIKNWSPKKKKGLQQSMEFIVSVQSWVHNSRVASLPESDMQPPHAWNSTFKHFPFSRFSCDFIFITWQFFSFDIYSYMCILSV